MAVSFCGKRIILTRNALFKTPKRHGYIVLVPEIGEDLPDKNPLLKDDGLPEFNRITIERCIAAIGKQTLEFEQTVKNIEETLETNKSCDLFDDVLNPMEDLGVSLETTWGLAKSLYFGNQSLMPTKSYLYIHDRASHARSAKFNSKLIYEACKKTRNNVDAKLTDEQRTLVSKFVLEGKLAGLDVTGKDWHRLQGDFDMLREKRVEFKGKLEVANKLFKHQISDPHVMKDFPEDYLRLISVDPMQPHRGPWNINLQSHIMTPFMEYCPNRDLRWHVWQASVMRASMDDNRSIQNSSSLEEIRFRRASMAKIIGYESYADLSMETKMAGSVKTVHHVLDSLLEIARPAQEREINELTEFAKERGLDEDIQIWDVPYWSRKHARTMYKYDEDMLKEYFPLPKVLDGLFQLAEKLFNINIVEGRKVDVWHKDVRFFDIIDLNGSTAEPIASFYLDAYARREEKMRVEKDSGWMVAIRNKSIVANTTPLAALVFNFQPPLYGKPSLLSFRDAHVLFQKFGHSLQHLLTTVNYSELSGLSNVEWDATGISGKFMANWLYEPSTMTKITGHYDTNEPLPEETVKCLTHIRSHMAGYNLCKELYLSRLDLDLYSNKEFWPVIVKRLWPRHFVFPLDKKDSHVCSFESIFADNWAAAYYSHIWSEMIAADIYGAFQEIPANDEVEMKETGKRYRDTFLSLGGSCPTNEIFRRFRGRDPTPKALVKNLGLKANKKPSTQ